MKLNHLMRTGGPVEKFMDILAAYLLAAALCAGCFPALSLGDSMGGAALAALPAMAVIVLCTVRWWIFPAFVCGSAALLCCGVWLSGQWESFYAYTGGLINWCFAGLPDAAPYSANGSIRLLCFLAALPAVALSLFLIRKLFSLALLAALAGLETAVLWLTGSPCTQEVLLVLGATLIISMPRAAQQRREKREGGGKLPRAPLQFLALNGAFCCILLTAVIVPQSEPVWRCEPLVALLGDVGDAFQYHFGALPFGPEFGLSRSGFAPLGDRLGGAIQPDQQKLLRVTGKVPPVLRGSIRDTYTGNSWTDAAGNSRFRFDSLYWARQQKQVFSSPAGSLRGEARRLYERVTTEVSYDVSYLSGSMYWIFTADTGGRITSPDWKDQTFYFNNQGEIYAFSPLSGSFKYHGEGRVFDPGLPGYEQNLLQLEKLAKPGLFEKAPSGVYLQLPEGLPDSVREAAADAVGDAATPVEKALRLERFLGEMGVYTQSPETPPEERDFVAYFLETKEGYCTYFATAMAVLARCEGIPSRYVTGYGLVESGKPDSLYYALNSSAHAWTELYFDGIGWVPFDPLFWNRPQIMQPVEQQQPQATPEPSAEEPVQREPASTPKEEEPVDIAPAKEEENASSMAIFILLDVLVFLAAAVRLGYARSFKRLERLWEPERVARKIPDPSARAEHYYQDLLRQLALYDLQIRPGETLSLFAEKAGRRLPGEAADLARMAETITALRFGGVAPDEDGLSSLARCHWSLEQNLRQKFPPWEYFVRRILPSFFRKPTGL